MAVTKTPVEEVSNDRKTKRNGTELTRREDKRPPPQVEWELPLCKRRRCEPQPQQTEAPHDQAQEDAHDVEDLAAHGREDVEFVEDLAGDDAELHDSDGVREVSLLERLMYCLPECALAQGPDGEHRADDRPPRDELVQCETLKVDCDDDHGKGHGGAPHDVRHDDCDQCVVRVREDLGYDAAGRGRDDGGYDGQQPGGRHGLELGLMSGCPVQSARGSSTDREGKKNIQQERHVETRRHGHDGVDPPHHPRHGGRPVAPRGHADEDHEVDNGREAHGERAQQHRVRRVIEHLPELVGPHGVAHDGDGEEQREHGNVEREDDDGDVVQAVELVGEVLEEDGGDAGAHVCGEPSDRSGSVTNLSVLNDHGRTLGGSLRLRTSRLVAARVSRRCCWTNIL